MAFDTVNWAMGQRELNSTTQLVLIKLAHYRNQKTGQCNPSQKTLAAACNMSVSTVNVHLRILADKNLIQRIRRMDKLSRATLSTQYEFPEASQVKQSRDRKSSQ
jgi:DNA-binding MarR family transcriptional regulator